MKQHKRAVSAIGNAIRKYGFDNFKVRRFKFETIQEAYELERILIQHREVESRWYYNLCIGGIGSNRTNNPKNPWLDEEFKAKRMLQLRSKENIARLKSNSENPKVLEALSKATSERWKCKEYRKDIEDKACKLQGSPVMSMGIEYPSVRQAAKAAGITPASLRGRIKSENYLDCYYKVNT
jgi:hypothetical protein